MMNDIFTGDKFFIMLIAAIVCAGLVSFTSTPIARVLAFRIGAMDIPRDGRRMHHIPIPRMGGLAVYFAFIVVSAVFCNFTPTLFVMWTGGLLVVILGAVDDVKNLNFLIKLTAQIIISLIPVSQGLLIERVNLFGKYIHFGAFSPVITVLWIVGLMNAINLIDGLDGLCSGIAAICSFSMLLVALVLSESATTVILTAIIAGACLGFLPYNTNPAKIFLGDTGALFLGYSMAILSIDGLFKFHAVMSFLIPLSIFGLPLADTAFAFFRRIIHGKNPFSADRGHIHHRLIDMGFNQKQSVRILYAVSGILGISAVLFTTENLWRAGLIIVVGFAVLIADYLLVANPGTRHQAGLGLPGDALNEECKESDEDKPSDTAQPEPLQNTDTEQKKQNDTDRK